LLDAKGRLLLQSHAFDSAKEAGVTIARLREISTSSIDPAAIGTLGEGVGEADIVAALTPPAEPG
jgi:hypothetical protein